MPVNDELGKRIKRYEAVPQISLMRRTPVIIRIDGKAFHTFTKGLQRPWDNILRTAMDNTMMRLAAEIQGCFFAYNQSDEITLVLQDFETLTTDAWFGYEVEKLCSISASTATLYFNQEFRKLAEREIWDYHHSMVPQSMELQQEINKYHDTLRNCINKGALFDARCFNVPREEVVNTVYWRQLDAVRNSIQSCGQYYFSHKELHKKNTKDILEMLKQKGISWETSPICVQRGTACYKTEEGWVLDKNIPMLKGDGRKYLEDLIPEI